ncbi:hypothetical protein WJX74_009070 [Apatococcus lobatus]|uniref:ABC transporter domain-containing protein n=1 Tax=Apatococcus lobatus TaxID=904363 RepID=A0AAW1SCD2_9CHLO
MPDALLDVANLQRSVAGHAILTGLSFQVRIGEVLFIRGASGVGKSLLLRALAYLDPIEGGVLTLEGRTPEQLGVPKWRARVTYVPQTRVLNKGTPSELYFAAQQFKAQKGRPRSDLPAIIHDLGLEPGVLNQQWSELSGGQAQRVVLALALALQPKILLLDEVTSALDHDAVLKVEKVLKACGAALIWVTHNDTQPARVGGRVLVLPLGTEMVVEQLPSSNQQPTHDIDK